MFLFSATLIIAVSGHYFFLLIGFVFGSLGGNQIGVQGAIALAQQLCHLVNLEKLL